MTIWRLQPLVEAVWAACADSRPERRGLGQRPSNVQWEGRSEQSERRSQQGILLLL